MVYDDSTGTGTVVVRLHLPVVRLCVCVCVVMNVSLFKNLQLSYSLNCPEKQEVPGELQKAALLLRVQRVLCNLSS